MIREKQSRIIIIGAGFAGREIAEEIASKGILGKVVAFIDDDDEKIGRTIAGVPIYGPISAIEEILGHCPADEALIATPAATSSQLRRIYTLLQRTNLSRIRILPRLAQIIDGDAHLIQTREISAQDLLGRDPIHIGLKESLAYLKGKRVLITGAGGSIGSELARQLLSGGAERLYLFDHGENSVYEIEKELRLLQEEGVGDAATIVPIIGEMQDSHYMDFILQRTKADVIFHCAAYKHVPLLEHNPVEAIKNNVFGTKNLVDAARKNRVPRFVIVSTDKAVQPTSMYGASKSLAEEIVLDSNGSYGDYIVVRFGNVLGSRGSIVPLFNQQIQKGGPVTITHPEASRFFMTIPEAASLVLNAGGVGLGGNVYILDMGEPVLIKELAEQMIRFYGYKPEVEIPIRYVGLRPGEKTHEKLWLDNERIEKTSHPGINRLLRYPIFKAGTKEVLDRLRPYCFFDPEQPELYRNRKELRQVIRDYLPSVQEPENEPVY
ncbi:MAG TPA: polysaccharide biosynthesis protein [Sediminispirochaeta sp.]|nr:polysaccharide biosynthesis protein [Sediminispirochaeta sp.]